MADTLCIGETRTRPDINQTPRFSLERSVFLSCRSSLEMADSAIPATDPEVFPGGRCRLLLLGSNSCGKSSVGNTIMCKSDVFRVAAFNSGSNRVNVNEKFVVDHGCRVTDMLLDLNRFMGVLHPGPHAVLYCLSSARRFTQEDAQAREYQQVKEHFGEDLVKHMIIVFTHWDDMEKNFPTPESFIHERTDKLKALLEDVDGRYVMLNNKADWPDRIQQSKRLVAEVKKLVEKSGGVFRWPSEDLIKRVFFELSTKMGAGWRDFISFLPGWSSRERLLAVIDQAREDEKLVRDQINACLVVWSKECPNYVSVPIILEDLGEVQHARLEDGPAEEVFMTVRRI
ncbi:hypothetical protein BaRGS_00034790, partial [Batillaria attramentaria]